MPSINQPRGVSAEDPPGAIGPDQADEAVSPALLGETMIERAKTVVVVARRCDEDQAAQILLDAASEAHIPLRMAADQVMSALQADDDRAGITQDTLAHALGSVRPVERPRDQDPLPSGPSTDKAA
ncbi:ANTAR domain-containing protein [Promicromonospora sp. NPDC023987]|uniref:ANTAR domain-containing protein n=1 Tax=Promicromonospora sp. NPDC023987 TaxID=3155360 RepID=UPI00340033F3